MGALELTLIVIGLVIIAASYAVSEKMTSGKEEVKEFETVADYEKRKELEENVYKRFETMAGEAVDKVDASLCKLSNEKIMAVNEYGDMVLERIDKNHSEVVFLYSMLTDKEKELKQFVMDSPVKAAMPDEELVNEQEATEMDAPSADHLLQSQAKELHRNRPKEEEEMKFSEQHDEILALLNSGKSIREISKELDLGQGEVQLVANLYAGGRK